MVEGITLLFELLPLFEPPLYVTLAFFLLEEPLEDVFFLPVIW